MVGSFLIMLHLWESKLQVKAGSLIFENSRSRVQYTQPLTHTSSFFEKERAALHIRLSGTSNFKGKNDNKWITKLSDVLTPKRWEKNCFHMEYGNEPDDYITGGSTIKA